MVWSANSMWQAGTRHPARLARHARRLLELQPPGCGGPTMIITDQAAHSDQVFGLYWLLGYQFSPRPQGFPTSASGTSPATTATARCMASHATASTRS